MLGRPQLRKTLQGIARAHGTRPQRQAAPLLTAAIIKLAAACGGGLRGERDRALILLGFADAFRRSELVKIQVADLTFGPHGLSVFLPRSKTDQLGKGSIVHIAANPLAAHCPAAAVQSWLDAASIRQGWLFRRVTRNDTLGRHGCLVPGSRDATLTREGEEALWQAVFTAQPERRREFEPSSKRRKRRLAS